MVHDGGPERRADAVERAWRTFGQGAIVAALVSVGTVLTTLETSPDWKGVIVSIGQAVVTAIVTYWHNRLRPKV